MSKLGDAAVLKQQLATQVSQISNIVNAKAKNVAQRESMLRQGQLPSDNAQSLERNVARNVGPMLAPGNLGDINKIIWPYWFSTDVPDTALGVNETFQTGFSITQEAAFIMMSFTKTVYVGDGGDPEVWTALNPNDESSPANLAPGLTFTLRDGSSSRQLYDRPIEIGLYGNPRFPTKFPRPIMFMPNQVVQIAFANSHPTARYAAQITAFGYRMRIEDAERFLSLVYA